MTLPIKDGRLDPLPAWLTAPSARAVIAALEAVGGEGCARFVGGCVRDTLLGRADEVVDVDIATTLTPDRTIAALEANGLRAIPTGIEHGTVTALSGDRSYEITTLRRDVETDGRRAVVAFTDDWAEDAARRDFRLNALYAEPDGTLHDPTGGGLEDVAARRIVFVGDPETRIREDYLRILRFFRFLARVGDAAEADPAGLAACAKLKDGIAGLSGERVREEMFKLLGALAPLPAVELMTSSGVLQAALPGATTDSAMPLADHLTIERGLGDPGDSLLRLASLTPHRTAAVAARLKLSNEDRDRIVAAWNIQPLAAKTDADVHRLVYRFRTPGFGDRVRMSAVNGDLTWPEVRWLLVEGDWSPPPFPLTGEDLMALGVPEGPQVGAVRKAVEQWWVDGDFQAAKAEALAYARTVIEGTDG